MLSVRGIDSFKVLTECPLIVMLLFQLYPRYIQSNIPQLTPLMMGALALRVPICTKREFRDKYREFLACQVKTLSFLTYLLRGFAELMRPYEDAISTAVIALMVACPSDAITTRKELLVATRHILATDFRRGFFRHVDMLLDETVLLGTGQRNQDALRPLAFSTLADLVHHVREFLSMLQVNRVIFLFARNLHDSVLPSSVQTTSVRLLLNLVDLIFHAGRTADPVRKRVLLVFILKCLTTKFDSLRFSLHKLIRKEPRHAGCVSENRGREVSILTYPANYDHDMHAKEYNAAEHASEEPGPLLESDVRPLIQTLIRGVKTVMWCIIHVNLDKCDSARQAHTMCTSDCPSTQMPDGTGGTLKVQRCVADAHANLLVTECRSLTFDEKSHISNFFCWGLLCCRSLTQIPTGRFQDAKEVVDNFAGAFTFLHSQHVRATLGQHIPFLYDALISSPHLVAVAQLLLANSNVSATFADLSLEFLITKLGRLEYLEQAPYSFATSDIPRNAADPSFGTLTQQLTLRTGKVPRAGLKTLLDEPTVPAVFAAAMMVHPQTYAVRLLHLFRIILGSVALFPTNERLLRNRLYSLTDACLHGANLSSNPLAYCILLRSIFRCAASGIVAPVQSAMLRRRPDDAVLELHSTFLLLRRRSEPLSAVRSILNELCLTLPYHLMRRGYNVIPDLLPVLAEALVSCSDLAPLALRTIEKFVDTVGVTPMRHTVLTSSAQWTRVWLGVCGHLKPPPYVLGPVALRILGKLGGQNFAVLRSDIAHQCDDHYCTFTHHMSEGASDTLGFADVGEAFSTRDLQIKLYWGRRHPQGAATEYRWSLGAAKTEVDPGDHFNFRMCDCVDGVSNLSWQLLRYDVPSAQISTSCPLMVLRRYRTLCLRFLLSALSCYVASSVFDDGTTGVILESEDDMSKTNAAGSGTGRCVPLPRNPNFCDFKRIHRLFRTLILACACTDVRHEARQSLRSIGTYCIHQMLQSTRLSCSQPVSCLEMPRFSVDAAKIDAGEPVLGSSELCTLNNPITRPLIRITIYLCFGRCDRCLCKNYR